MHAWMLVAALVGMQLRSPDLTAGGPIPAPYMARDCGGSDRVPVLRWAHVPGGVKSFALIVHDPDAPVAGGFYHWVVYDIPAWARELTAAPQGIDGRASTGRARYEGPCPPPGPAHHYVFTLYALDVRHVSASSPLTGPALEQRLRGHIVARASFTATAAHR